MVGGIFLFSPTLPFQDRGHQSNTLTTVMAQEEDDDDDCKGDDDEISENIQTSLHLNIQSLLAVSFVVLISSKRYSSRHSLGKTTWFPVRRDTRFVAKTNGFLSHRVCISYLLTFVFSQADKFRFIRAEKLELVEHGRELRSFISQATQPFSTGVTFKFQESNYFKNIKS